MTCHQICIFIETKVLKGLACCGECVGDLFDAFDLLLSFLGQKRFQGVACVGEGLGFFSGFDELSGRCECGASGVGH